MRYSESGLFLGLFLVLAATDAQATIAISSDPTSNMSCVAGVCEPTAVDATLNVTDLENLLAAGNVEIATTGSGVEAKSITVTAAFTWSSASTLALRAKSAIQIAATISVAGPGGLDLLAADRNAVSYDNGNITFADLGSSLKIGGKRFVLVSDIKKLATKVAQGENVALANNYDASADGTYSASPVITPLTKLVDGLGNQISNLSVNSTGSGYVALFESIAISGRLANLIVANASVTSLNNGATGILVGANSGVVARCGSSGSASDTDGYVGGLVGFNSGTVTLSHSSASVTGATAGGLVGSNYGNGFIRRSSAAGTVVGATSAGGLVAANAGVVDHSYASGSVSSSTSKGSIAGGLVAQSKGVISYSYAKGAVSSSASAGGLVGGLSAIDTGWIAQSFATGPVAGGASATAGGLVGQENGKAEDSYATGSVAAGNSSSVGGLAGCVLCSSGAGTVLTSYSTGTVGRSQGGHSGGFAGSDDSFGGISQSYWDTTTSGLKRGTGNRGNEPGIAGLTTKRLQSQLPYGFDPHVWKENPNINGGLPYLIANPPPN